MSVLVKANLAFQHKDYQQAVGLYEQCLKSLDTQNEKTARFVGSVQFCLDLALERAIKEYSYFSDSQYQRILHGFPKAERRQIALRLVQDASLFKDKIPSDEDRTSLPLVSVVMPVYNRAGEVLKSVQTVLEQTYEHFELLICDDGSTDDTFQILNRLSDPRIRLCIQANAGAASARNHALRMAKGEVITYLDSDNFWHPEYLSVVVQELATSSALSVYTDFVDYVVDEQTIQVKGLKRPEFSHENLIQNPFIDLNTFAHKRILYDVLGGFDESLVRRQDYDIMLKYTWLRDPVFLPLCLGLYQRNQSLDQITFLKGKDLSPVAKINAKISDYFAQGLPVRAPVHRVKKVTVLVWDHCRNHFSKAFAVAEALSRDYVVELIAFDFFDEGVFAPLASVSPGFETKYFKGGEFPDFLSEMERALEAITGDMIYVVKPRLPSFGLAMLANARKGVPFCLEVNDLEAIVANPREQDVIATMEMDKADSLLDTLRVPYSDDWSSLLEPLISQVPVLVTHNQNLDIHYGAHSYLMRNLKDESVYDPSRYDRAVIRADMGISLDDKVILFGGMIRKHKGIYELVALLEKLQDPSVKLLFVGSRTTPDERALLKAHSDQLIHLPSQCRDDMAKINLAADLVILWLDPSVPASHYQFPYKATDAFAMKTPVIANDISDLGDLAKQGYLKIVPFADWDAMLSAVRDIFEKTDQTQQQVDAAHRLYTRQFSYQAARDNFRLISHAVIEQQAQQGRVYPVSKQFDQWFKLVSGRVFS